MTTVSSLASRKGRNVELGLLVFAVGIVVLAYVNVGIAVEGAIPPSLVAVGIGLPRHHRGLPPRDAAGARPTPTR